MTTEELKIIKEFIRSDACPAELVGIQCPDDEEHIPCNVCIAKHLGECLTKLGVTIDGDSTRSNRNYNKEQE